MIAFQNRMAQSVVALPFQYGLCFAASCCERLAPIYTAFSLVEKWGDPKALKHGNDIVWRCVAGEHFEDSFLTELITVCEKSIPVLDEVDFFLDMPAGAACGAIAETLRACRYQDQEMLTAAGECAMDAVYDYIRVLNSSNLIGDDYQQFLKNIEMAPLVLEEMHKQEATIASLSALPILDSDFLKQLRVSATATGIRPFERGFVPNYLWLPIYEPGLVPAVLARMYAGE